MLGMLGLILWITIQGANYPSQILSEFLFLRSMYGLGCLKYKNGFNVSIDDF